MAAPGGFAAAVLKTRLAPLWGGFVPDWPAWLCLHRLVNVSTVIFTAGHL
jgi:hypothetical protein